MKRYWMFTRNSIIAGAVYRFHFFFTSFSNLVYIVLLYFLWQSIYKGSSTINSMDFNQVFVYLALSSSVFWVFKSWVEWDMSSGIVNGTIITKLTKPLDLQLQLMFDCLGFLISNFVMVLVPALLMILFVFHGKIPVSYNILFFFIAIALAFIINFNIDYMIGLTSFYTESVWGIAATKDVIVLFLSGATIPIRFFPSGMREVLQDLPFQCIYNTPISILVRPEVSFPDSARMIGVQLIWVAVTFILSRLYYKKAVKVITVNGG